MSGKEGGFRVSGGIGAMDLPPEIDDCIKESIDYFLGLPLSARTLESKLRSSKEVQKGLRDQCSRLYSKLKEKDDLIELARVYILTASTPN